MMAEIIWTDKKRTFLGLPWSFTRYSLTKDKLLTQTGFLRRNEEEVRLYRILDVTLRRSLMQRLFGLGTVHCCSADSSTPEFDIKSVKNSQAFKDLFSDAIEESRRKNRVSGREYMQGADDDSIEAHDMETL